jgi:hypothetical protein
VTNSIHCQQHGQQKATFVCDHIFASLHEGAACGFLWFLDEDGGYQAICTACNEMPFADWQARSSESIRMLCYSCYIRAAEANGVSRVDIEAVRH